MKKILIVGAFALLPFAAMAATLPENEVDCVAAGFAWTGSECVEKSTSSGMNLMPCYYISQIVGKNACPTTPEMNALWADQDVREFLMVLWRVSVFGW